MEEYTSDEGNYSSISSASGFSAFDDEVDFKGGPHLSAGSTDAEKYLLHLLQIDNSSTIWNKPTESNETLLLKQQINQELIEQNKRLENDNKELLQQYEILQGEINQLQNEKGCRESCITHLKQKITEQQGNIHDLTQQNFKLNIDLSYLNNELITTNGMVDWYKNEWNSVNIERNSLQKEVFLAKNNLRSKTLEITRLEALLSDIKLKKQENIQETLPKTVVSISRECKEENSQTDEVVHQNVLEYYLCEINDLSQELATVRKSFQQQTEELSMLIKEKSEIVQKQTVLQNELDENKKVYILKEEEVESLKFANEQFEITMKQRAQDIFKLKTQLNTLNIQLSGLTKEKLQVQASIIATRGNFHKMIAVQDELKEQLKQKSLMMINLRKKLLEFTTSEVFQLNKNKGDEDINLKSDLDAKNIDFKLMLQLDEVKKYCEGIVLDNAELNLKLKETCLEKENVESCKLKEMEKLCCKFGLDFDVNYEIDEVIHMLDTYITSKCQSVDLVKVMNEQLELRCIDAAKKCSAVDILNAQLTDEVKRLKDVLYLKDIDFGNRQKRYQKYYHTLLKKVKQSMLVNETKEKVCNELRSQLLSMYEELNTKKLEIFQYEVDKSSNNNQIAKKNALIQQLQAVVKQQEAALSETGSHLEKLRQRYQESSAYNEALNQKYEELVSTHSKCLSTIETVMKEEQEQLDDQKTNNCMNDNTQHTLIEKLENEKRNALKVISTLDRINREHFADVQTLHADKTFLQRLIIDMKSALNASAAKQHVDMTKPLTKPIDFSIFKCPPLKNESEIVSLCDSFIETKTSQESIRDLYNSIIDLKTVMSDMQTELGDLNRL